jgi:DNA-binding transcriptional MocR family regulator
LEQERFLTTLGIWTEGTGPRYMQLASAFQRAIAATEIPAQTRLPAERVCAQWLRLSRSTVVAAYRLLEEEGWITRRHGSGAWVNTLTPERSARYRNAQLQPLARWPVFDSLQHGAISRIDLATGAVLWPETSAPTPYLPIPAEIEALGKEIGYLPQGYLPLRRAIAHHYTRQGMPTSPECILVTTGAQQAIALVASCFLQRGDAIMLESPTYYGAIDAFRSLGLRLHSIPVTDEGLDLDRLRQRMRANVAQWLYLIPTVHNPTGTSIGGDARRSVAKLADKQGIMLIEDLSMAELTLNEATFPPLATFAPDGGVISIGSMSKVIWGGLRVGWVRAREAIIGRLARFKAIQDLGSPLLNQVMAAHILDDLPALLAQRRRELANRLAQMEACLHQWLPEWRWRHPTAGLYIWAQLPHGDAQELAQFAAHRGVLITPGSTLSVDDDHHAYLRLAYLRPPHEITTGLERLRLAWEDYSRAQSVPRPEPRILV